MDLGARGWQTLRLVTLPLTATALVSGALLAFGLSFDEVIVTVFTAGAQNTPPLWIFGAIRLGHPICPQRPRQLARRRRLPLARAASTDPPGCGLRRYQPCGLLQRPARPAHPAPSPVSSALLSLSCSDSVGQQGQDHETV